VGNSTRTLIGGRLTQTRLEAGRADYAREVVLAFAAEIVPRPDFHVPIGNGPPVVQDCAQNHREQSSGHSRNENRYSIRKVFHVVLLPRSVLWLFRLLWEFSHILTGQDLTKGLQSQRRPVLSRIGGLGTRSAPSPVSRSAPDIPLS